MAIRMSPASMRRPKALTRPASQSGAVLYVALIMLILLSLLGIIGMQVTVLQERMAANYTSAAVAFQGAESRARNAECYVEALTNRTTGASACTAVTVESSCNTGFDPSQWATARTWTENASAYVAVRSIGKCISGNTSLAMGVKPETEEANPVYQVTSYATNDAANPAADAAVDTIFRP